MTASAGEAFRVLRRALEAAGVRFAVGGSWASAAYGEARFTNDIDILADFDASGLNRFLDLLPVADLDQSYLRRGAERLGVTGLLDRAMRGQTGGG
jgi:predicted nucleotidyltransferase